MSRIKDSDCFKCKKWIAECGCEPAYPYHNGEPSKIVFNEGDKVAALMRDHPEEVQSILAEASDYWASVPF